MFSKVYVVCSRQPLFVGVFVCLHVVHRTLSWQVISRESRSRSTSAPAHKQAQRPTHDRSTTIPSPPPFPPFPPPSHRKDGWWGGGGGIPAYLKHSVVYVAIVEKYIHTCIHTYTYTYIHTYLHT